MAYEEKILNSFMGEEDGGETEEFNSDLPEDDVDDEGDEGDIDESGDDDEDAGDVN